MDVIKKVYPNPYKSNLFDFYMEKGKIAVVDIETTGLSALYNKIIIFGIVEITPDALISTQYFAENSQEEIQVLKEIPKYLDALDVIVTFNGASFDLPFIRKRLEKHTIATLEEGSFIHLDLYKIIKKQQDLFQLHSYSQKSVETYMNIHRNDTISGGESVALYKAYEKTRRKAYKKTILLHNQDDIYNLTKIMSIYDKLDIHFAMFHTGFLVKGDQGKFNIEKIKITQHHIMIYGSVYELPFDIATFKDGYTLETNKERNTFSLKIFLEHMHNSAYVEESNFDFDISKFKIKEVGYWIKIDHEINYYLVHFLIKHILLENM